MRKYQNTESNSGFSQDLLLIFVIQTSWNHNKFSFFSRDMIVFSLLAPRERWKMLKSAESSFAWTKANLLIRLHLGQSLPVSLPVLSYEATCQKNLSNTSSEKAFFLVVSVKVMPEESE